MIYIRVHVNIRLKTHQIAHKRISYIVPLAFFFTSWSVYKSIFSFYQLLNQYAYIYLILNTSNIYLLLSFRFLLYSCLFIYCLLYRYRIFVIVGRCCCSLFCSYRQFENIYRVSIYGNNYPLTCAIARTSNMIYSVILYVFGEAKIGM